MSESKTIEYYSRDNVKVFWNLEDYPIPSGVNVKSIPCNISRALYVMGFYGYMESIDTYGDEKGRMDELLDAGIKTESYRESIERSDVSTMPLRMIFAAKAARAIFLVIAKQSPQGELHRVQQCLKLRNHTVLVLDDTAQEIDFDSEKSLVECTRVFGGGKPISKRFYDSDSDVDDIHVSKIDEDDVSKIDEEHVSKIDEDDVSKIEEEHGFKKIVNFSEPITLAKGVINWVIFWDVVAFPFPLCSDPDDIYFKIEKALRDRGCEGDMSIWAYVDDENNGSWSGDQYLRDKTWQTSIYFLPGGASRRRRMLNDMHLLVWDSRQRHPITQTQMMVFSDQFREGTYFRRKLQNLHHSFCNRVMLVAPTQHVIKPESLEWPGVLLDEQAYFFHDANIQ